MIYEIFLTIHGLIEKKNILLATNVRSWLANVEAIVGLGDGPT